MDLRRKWVPPARKRGMSKLRFHLMCDNDTTYCGLHMIPDTKRALDFDDWCPLDHQDRVCPQCLEWWKTLRPGKYGRKKAASS